MPCAIPTQPLSMIRDEFTTINDFATSLCVVRAKEVRTTVEEQR